MTDDPKQHYSTCFHPQTKPDRISIRIYHRIIETLAAGSIFEFGCGVGRHLKMMHDLGYDVAGIDVNKDCVEQASEELNISIGDENSLVDIPTGSYDLVFSVSTLCHMPREQAMVALNEMRRIAPKVILCEAAGQSSWKWFDHTIEYSNHGFHTFHIEKSEQGYLYQLWEV
jgi:2-polyprenyl-3-methyl-5-hydroxy-6-metoxy-1,4-benzoquinol methylase